MQEVIQTNEAKCAVFHDYLAQTYVPQLSNHLAQTDAYLEIQQQDFQKIHSQSDQLIENIMEKKTIISKTVKQLNEKIQSEQEKLKKAETYKKGKKDEMAAIQKAIDSISSAMKETCSKVNSFQRQIDSKELNKIGQLPPGMDQFLAKLFNIIYNEDQNKFSWPEFKKKVFDQDKGADFQSRLANFQFKGVSQEKESFLLQMKADPQFQKVYQDPQFTRAFLDIADWIHFAVSGIENQRKKISHNKNTKELKKNSVQENQNWRVFKKLMQILQKLQDFWVSQLQYAEDQLVFLNSFQPNIKQVEYEINQSKNALEKHINEFVNGAKKINDLITQTI